MADLPAQSIANLEELLTGLGYDLKGHATGQADGVLDKAITDALTQVQTMFRLEKHPIDTLEFRTGVLKGVAAFKEETTEVALLTLNNYEEFKGAAEDGVIGNDLFGGTLLETVREGGMPQQFIDNPGGVVTFVDNPDRYMQAYGKFVAYQAAEPSAGVVTPPTTSTVADPKVNSTPPPAPNAASPKPDYGGADLATPDPADTTFKPAAIVPNYSPVPKPNTTAEPFAASSQKQMEDLGAELSQAVAGSPSLSASVLRLQTVLGLQPTGRWDLSTFSGYANVTMGFQRELGMEETGLYSKELLDKISLHQAPVDGSPKVIARQVEALKQNAEGLKIFVAAEKEENPDATDADIEKALVDLATQQVQQYNTQLQQFPLQFANAIGGLAEVGFLDRVNEQVSLAQKTAPPPAARPQQAGASNSSQVVPETAAEVGKSDVVKSVEFIEKFLHFAGPMVDEINPLPKGKVTLPTVVDGTMDAGTQAGLQQVFGALRAKLGVGQQAGETSTMVYSPAIGQLILDKLNKTEDKDLIKLRDKLVKDVPAFINPKTGKPHAAGADSLLEHLNFLASENQIAEQKVAESVISEIALSGMQSKILMGVVGFLNKSFPSLLPMIDGFLRDFMGMGILDLLPADMPGMDKLRDSLGGLSEDPEERLSQLFTKTFVDKDADGKDLTPEDHLELKDQLVTSARWMRYLPAGDVNYRNKYPEVADQALTAALEKMHAGDLDLNEAGDYFSAEFSRLIDRPGRVVQRDPNPAHAKMDKAGKPVVDAEGNLEVEQFGLDSLMVDHLTRLEFDPDGDGQHDRASVQANIEKLKGIYYGINGYDADGYPPQGPLADETPILLKTDDDVYIVGIDGPSNLLTIQPLILKNLRADYEEHVANGDKSVEDIYDTYSGLELAMESYSSGFFADSNVPASTPADKLLYMAEHAFNYEEWSDKASAKLSTDMNDNRLFDTELEAADLKDLKGRIEGKIYKKIIEDIAGGSGSVSSSEFTHAMRQKDGRNTLSDRQQEILGMAEKAAPEEFKTYKVMTGSNDSEQILANGPRLFFDTNSAGTGVDFYMLSGRNDHDTGSHFVVEVTDELEDYWKRDQELRGELVTDPDLMQVHCPGLMAVASQNFEGDEADICEHACKLAAEHVDQYEELNETKVGMRSFRGGVLASDKDTPKVIPVLTREGELPLESSDDLEELSKPAPGTMLPSI